MIHRIFKESYNKQSFLRNFSVLTMSNIIVNVLGLFINVYLARTLKPTLYGEYGVILTTAGIFYTLSSLGLQQIVIRSIARNQDNSKYYFQISLIARITGMLLAIVIFVIYSSIIDKEYSFLLYVLILLYMITMSGWDAFQNVAFGMQRMEYTGYINVIASTILLIIYLVLPKEFLNLDVIFIFIAIIHTGKLVLYYYNIKKNNFLTGVYCKKTDLKPNIHKLLKESFPYFILAVFTLFTTQMPVLFLDFNAGATEVAFFNTANKLLVPLTLLISTAMTALFPELSKLYVQDKKLFQKRVRISLHFLIILGVYCAIIVTLFRNEVVQLLYGAEYSSTGLIMAYQCWYVVLFSIFWFFGSVFGAVDKQNLLAKLSIVYALISVPILWYASKFGAEWVSIGYIVISVINMTYHFYFFQKVLPEKIKFADTLKDFGIIVVSFVSCMLLPVHISIYIRISIGLLVSLLTFIALKKSYLINKIVT